MRKDVERRYGRIGKAYCFELDAILDAYQALERGIRARDHHLFCPTPGCGWKLSGGVKGKDNHPDHDIAWFVGEDIPPGRDRSHVPHCEYGVEKRESQGNGSGVSTPPNSPIIPAEVFIPHELVDPLAASARKWPGKDPDPRTLEAMIVAATGKPIGGTLEEVVDAERHLAKRYFDFLERKRINPNEPEPTNGKPDQQLRIAGNDTNYRDGFCDLFGMELPLNDPGFFKSNIAHCRCLVTRDRVRGNEFILHPTGKKFTILVDIDIVAPVEAKIYIRDLFEKDSKSKQKIGLKCFLWDLQPLIRKDNGRPTLRIDSLDALMRIAIREVPSKANASAQE